ncbi:uncharacterized protein LOC144344827 [Saccoglossus kowalevskii]
MKVVSESYLQFPGISICNTNKLRKSAIEKSEHKGLNGVDDDIVFPYYGGCMANDFACNNTGCIKNYLHCDGYDNCRDRSDEMGCKYGRCGNTEFRCPSGSDMGVCIKLKFKCDRHLDCYDGEDENECVCKEKKEFSCLDNGRCVPVNKLCDGNNDCADGSDEKECSEDGNYCPSDYFKCDNGRTCIPAIFKCDGGADCSDETDEMSCPTQNPDTIQQCSYSEYQCEPGHCIQQSYVCDNDVDCSSGSDEKNCGGCADDQFHCDESYCIDNSWLCDGEYDCMDGTDELEMNCITSSGTNSTNTNPCQDWEFYCGDDKCINGDWECDTESDCPGGQDEVNCPTCADNGAVIRRSYVCDGNVYCADASDEANCTVTTRAPTSTEVGSFMCELSGKLVERQYVCNNVVDCDDASDEYNCHNGKETSYIPDAEELLRNYSTLSTDLSLFEDFVSRYYIDNMFGRVVRENPPDWPGFIAYSSSPDYSDLAYVLKLRTDEMHKLGHQLNDFVLHCTFDSVKCDMEKDFLTFYDDRYGNCFQYNYKHDHDSEQLLSTKTGPRYGLKLTLFTEQDEYISVYGHDSGARVVIHPSYMRAMPWSEGFTIAPGKIAFIGIKETRVDRQPAPYGECATNIYQETVYGKYYKESTCEESCIQDRMMEYCGCVDTMLRNATRCMLLNRTQDTCRQLIYYSIQQKLLGCDCPQSCKERYYETSLSQSLWPSNTYLKHLLKQIHAENPKTLNINNLQTSRQNLIRLELYYDDLNFQQITEKPEVSEEALLSSIGGSLGLYCGFSFLTIVEFIQFAFDLVKLTYVRVFLRRLKPVAVSA